MSFTSQQILLDPEFQKKFTYRTAERDVNTTAETVTVRQIGHMLETLTDAMIFMNRLEANPLVNTSQDPAYEPVDDTAPAFLRRFADDPRKTPSYQRSDMERPRLTKPVHLSALINSLHAITRKQGNRIGEIFNQSMRCKKFPAAVREMVERYDAIIQEYKEIISDHGEDHKNVPAAIIDQYNRGYLKISAKLTDALQRQPIFPIEREGQIHELPQEKPLNPHLKNSYPLLVLLALRSVGKEMIDPNKRPQIEFEQLVKIVGVESLITDTIAELEKWGKSEHFDLLKHCDLDRGQLGKLLRQHGRDLRLAELFCRTADCGYLMLYNDLNLWARMAEEPPLTRLGTKQEVGLILYAIERRLMRKPGIEWAHSALHADFQNRITQFCALGETQTPAEFCAQDSALRQLLAQTQAIAIAHNLQPVIHALHLVEEGIFTHQTHANQLENAKRSPKLRELS